MRALGHVGLMFVLWIPLLLIEKATGWNADYAAGGIAGAVIWNYVRIKP